MPVFGKPYKKPGSTGWWLRWTEPGGRRRRTRRFPTLAMAEQYAAALVMRRSTDIWPFAIERPWDEARSEYLRSYEARGLSCEARDQATYTLDRFEGLVGCPSTVHLTQRLLDAFQSARMAESVSPWTVNKDMSNLRSFVNWCRHPSRHYLTGSFEFHMLKTRPPQVTALSVDRVRGLLAACPSPVWRMRLLLSLCSGLRSSDIDGLSRGDIDLENMTLRCTARKTGKPGLWPLPSSLETLLRGYISSLPSGELRLLPDRNRRKAWERITRSSGVACTRHDLRRTHCTLIQAAPALAAAGSLLQHSDLRTTRQWYTDEVFLLRLYVERLPVAAWLAPAAEPDAAGSPPA